MMKDTLNEALFLLLALGIGMPGPSLAAPRADDLKPGLIGEYFAVGEVVEDFPELGRKKPILRRIDPEVNFAAADRPFANTDLHYFFCVRWSGVIRIPKDGAYTLYTESDDGSRLYIDGKQIVDNGGLHAMEVKEGSLELKAGDHLIRVDFFQGEGGAGCRIYWAAQGAPKSIIPAEVLFHKRDDAIDRAK